MIIAFLPIVLNLLALVGSGIDCPTNPENSSYVPISLVSFKRIYSYSGIRASKFTDFKGIARSNAKGWDTFMLYSHNWV